MKQKGRTKKDVEKRGKERKYKGAQEGEECCQVAKGESDLCNRHKAGRTGRRQELWRSKKCGVQFCSKSSGILGGVLIWAK